MIGASTDLMADAWWGPTTVVPGEDRARMLFIEKSLPGSVLVNRRGERFVNEALPYVDAIGNCSASVMGRSYPSPGYTLGPTTTFGLIAARHVMEA